MIVNYQHMLERQEQEIQRIVAMDTVKTLEDAKAFITALVHLLGPGYHPETDAHDYITTSADGLDDHPTFSTNDADIIWAQHEAACSLFIENNQDVFEFIEKVSM